MAIRLDEQTLSDLPIPPGEVIMEEAAALGLTRGELAVALGLPAQTLDEVICGDQAVTEETAARLERVLGVGAHVWLGLESSYRMTLDKKRQGKRKEASRVGVRRHPEAREAGVGG